MSAIVVAYEDEYHEELHGLVKALRRDRGQAGFVLEAATVRGDGNFVNEVPRILRTPLKQTKRPPDRVVCVADADRPSHLAPGAQPPPAGADGGVLSRWVLDLEAAWHAHLVAEAKLAEEPASRLLVRCIRWNKETVLISSPEALLSRAGARRGQVQTILDGCDPPPATLADAEFVVRYQDPKACLDRIFQATEGRRYKKGRDDEDLLRDQIRPNADRRGEVLRRNADLERLLDVLNP